MINLLPTPLDALAESLISFVESATVIGQNIPVITNVAICADSICTTGHAGLNLFFSPNPLSKVFFGTRGVLIAPSSGVALLTSFTTIPVVGWVGLFGARAFNRLGKYTLHLGNITKGNTTKRYRNC
jgi:hypothetical protein